MPRTKKLPGQPKATMNPNSLRNLRQYQDMEDEEFVESLVDITTGTELDIELEDKINKEYAKYELSYDLTDLMPNDIATLRALILASIRLQGYEIKLNQLEAKGISDININVIEKLSKICKDLRDSMGSLQDVLKISRKVRRSEKEQSVQAALEDMKTKARNFYGIKMLYLLCPVDNNTLATTWFHNQDSEQNLVTAYCNRCKKVHTFKVSDLYSAKKSSNKENQLPESLR